MESNSDVPSASTLEAQLIRETDGERASTAIGASFMMYKTEYNIFLLSSMVNVFGESVGSGPGNLQMVKKVVATKGKYKDYTNEMRQSYELGFTLYRLHTNSVGTYVTPIRVYDGKVYVLDNVATMEVGERYIESCTPLLCSIACLYQRLAKYRFLSWIGGR